MPADEEVFKLRETEKRHKLEQREKVKHMHVHEKTTFASRMGTSLASSAVANVSRTISFTVPLICRLAE